MCLKDCFCCAREGGTSCRKFVVASLWILLFFFFSPENLQGKIKIEVKCFILNNHNQKFPSYSTQKPAGCCFLQKRRPRVDLINTCKYLKGGCQLYGARLFQLDLPCLMVTPFYFIAKAEYFLLMHSILYPKLDKYVHILFSLQEQLSHKRCYVLIIFFPTRTKINIALECTQTFQIQYVHEEVDATILYEFNPCSTEHGKKFTFIVSPKMI